ncbi:MAG: HlyD family efflux transporter periplasmic adaptor subunit [Anaerolineae bacterium]|nr:HlyD family efflux transporter periplasmic adaptor subunit [Anaerolineae bacterium]
MKPAAQGKTALFRSAATLLILAALAGCSGLAPASPEPLPTVVLDAGSPQKPEGTGAAIAPVGGGSVGASGVIIPSQLAELSFSTGGNVLKINVHNGEAVRAGQTLVQLDGEEKLDAAVKAANLELLAAEKALQELYNNAEQSRAAAQLRLAQALDKVDQAEKRRGWKEFRVGDPNQIDVARANYIIAEDHLKRAEELFSALADSPEDSLNRAEALSALATARIARDKALANLNYLLSLPNEIEVGKADAELEVARAELEAAQREYDLLKDGPDPTALALATARVENAKAQLLASQSALADLELKAPFDGVVSNLTVHNGEWVLPGQTILVLADLSRLQVETTDLSERDVMKVRIGQEVSVFVKALGEEISGRVSEISPLADTLGGDVVYKTLIDLDNLPTELRAGMSVDVQFLE